MKNKGFTLIELLGVIIILALLMIIVFPSIINSIKKSSNEKDELVVDLIYNATDMYISKNKNNYPKNNGNVYCIPLTQLKDTDYLKEEMLDIGEVDPSSKTVKITVTDKYSYEIVDNDKCEELLEQPTDASCFETTENKDGTLTISDYNCTDTDVIIPKIINGKTVTVIGNSAFNSNKLTSVSIPNSITSIGNYAFSSNKLTSVSIPNSVTSIGQAAFTCNDMPEEKAYIYNRNSDGSIDYTSLNSYAGSDNYIKRVIPAQVNEIALTDIGTDAFAGCGLYGEIIIPGGVTHIGSGAFSANYLINIEIPDSVTSIGYAAFNRNALKGDNEFIYNRNSDGTIDYTSLNSYAGENQGNIVIPGEVNGVKLTNIGMKAFYCCWIQGVTIPESVTHIGNAAFCYNRMTTITIPESVTHIGYRAFYNDDKAINGLTEVIIKGKSGPSDFTEYGSSIWGWASGYSDSNITWNG